jgi:hypothetical protein
MCVYILCAVIEAQLQSDNIFDHMPLSKCRYMQKVPQVHEIAYLDLLKYRVQGTEYIGLSQPHGKELSLGIITTQHQILLSGTPPTLKKRSFDISGTARSHAVGCNAPGNQIAAYAVTFVRRVLARSCVWL